jgi:hypothetical protein
LGYNLVARTGSLDMGFHHAFTGFESGMPDTRNPDVALILSTWIWVSKYGGSSPGQEILQYIISDVLKEMREQMCLDDIDVVVPLATVRKMMMVNWVWGCMTFHDGDLCQIKSC